MLPSDRLDSELDQELSFLVEMFRLFAVVLALASASAFVAPGHVASVSVRGSAVTMGAKKARP